MKLTIWIAPALTASSTYDLRSKTRKGIYELAVKYGYKKEEIADLVEEEITSEKQTENNWRYGKPEKIVLEYKDGFDLLNSTLNEAGYWQLQIN